MGDLSPGEGTDAWLPNRVCTAAVVVDSDAQMQEGDRRRSEKKSATTRSHPDEVRDKLISNGSELQPTKRNRTEQNPKEHSAATGVSYYVPAEIITDILLGLPFSSVVRFGYVTPEWRRSARRFVEDAFHNPKLAEHHLCLIFLDRNELYFADYPHENAGQRIAVKGIRKPFLHLNPRYRIEVSYDGMLLLSDSGNNALFIYNPFTHDYTELPGSINPRKTVIVGFGYCSFTEVYKVMRVIRYYDESVEAIADVQIFTTGRPIWRSLGAPPPSLKFGLCNPASHVVVNGRIHWHTFGPLFSFDLLDEQFRVIPKPKVSWLRKIQALVIGGCLAVAAQSCQRVLFIWVMTEYGVQESWVLKWIISKYIPQGLRDLNEERPGPFRVRNGETAAELTLLRKHIGEPVEVLNILESGKMLLMYRKTFLVLYDPSTKNFTDLELEELPTWIQTVVHKGRLTPVSTILSV